VLEGDRCIFNTAWHFLLYSLMKASNCKEARHAFNKLLKRHYAGDSGGLMRNGRKLRFTQFAKNGVVMTNSPADVQRGGDLQKLFEMTRATSILGFPNLNPKVASIAVSRIESGRLPVNAFF
jgi:hypothetical protein